MRKLLSATMILAACALSAPAVPSQFRLTNDLSVPVDCFLIGTNWQGTNDLQVPLTGTNIAVWATNVQPGTFTNLGDPVAVGQYFVNGNAVGCYGVAIAPTNNAFKSAMYRFADGTGVRFVTGGNGGANASYLMTNFSGWVPWDPTKYRTNGVFTLTPTNSTGF